MTEISAASFPLFSIVNTERYHDQGLLAALVTRQKRALLLFTDIQSAAAYIDDHNHNTIHEPVEIKVSTELEEILKQLKGKGISKVQLNPSKTYSEFITAHEVLAAIRNI